MSAIQHPSFKTLHIVEHPLVEHKLSALRSKDTPQHIFKQLIDEITLLLAYEATKNFSLVDVEIDTPLERMTGKTLEKPQPIVVPILRAGLGMVDSFISLMPRARVGHIGMFRNEETFQPEHYYFKLPENSADHYYFICDPMLATGNSLSAAIDKLKQHGIKHMTAMCIVSAPEGAKNLYQSHPDVKIYTAVLDRELNENYFIVPGLGDAGDRLFGTK